MPPPERPAQPESLSRPVRVLAATLFVISLGLPLVVTLSIVQAGDFSAPLLGKKPLNFFMPIAASAPLYSAVYCACLRRASPAWLRLLLGVVYLVGFYLLHFAIFFVGCASHFSGV